MSICHRCRYCCFVAPGAPRVESAELNQHNDDDDEDDDDDENVYEIKEDQIIQDDDPDAEATSASSSDAEQQSNNAAAAAAAVATGVLSPASALKAIRSKAGVRSSAGAPPPAAPGDSGPAGAPAGARPGHAKRFSFTDIATTTVS